ncbi:MAG: HNH endonuclease [Lachnospiraceae bacterium]|nr:HNH endonuclease [Lachnospiraceae bacterium]
MPKKNTTVFVDDEEQIKTFVQSRSSTMYNYVQNSKSRFTLWYKNLTHSDLTNRGKRNGGAQGLEKNYLYYLSVEEMKKIQEQSPNKPFESAKQSNIGMPLQFYSDLGIPRLERRKGSQKTQHHHIKLNESVDVLLVNDTLQYFTQEYTGKVLEKLGKYSSVFCSKNDVEINKSEAFTSIQLSEAIHGIGIEKDEEFHKLRLSMFLNDTIIFLIEHKEGRKKLFIMLEKNPRFFTLAGVTDTAWEKYLNTQRLQEKARITGNTPLESSEDEKSRKLQRAWKEKLANEMMTYSTEEGKVSCPFTGICADFKSFSMLFVASHIKRHVDCVNDKESFDVNNGLLLSANADALFDKYMISVNEEKKLIFSFLLEPDYKLRNMLLLNQPIFDMILNDERMKYLEVHRKIFLEKEEERRKLYSA